VACGSGDDGTTTAESPETPESSGSAPSEQGGTTLATSEVPVGGGTVLGEQEIVVTQPAEGEFMAFSAVCTHQGCIVQGVSDGTINCPCHGSQFSIEDGSVVNGPAQAPLENRSVSVEGDQLSVG
jgi:Rieske Fe-S protein